NKNNITDFKADDYSKFVSDAIWTGCKGKPVPRELGKEGNEYMSLRTEVLKILVGVEKELHNKPSQESHQNPVSTGVESRSHGITMEEFEKAVPVFIDVILAGPGIREEVDSVEKVSVKQQEQPVVEESVDS